MAVLKIQKALTWAEKENLIDTLSDELTDLADIEELETAYKRGLMDMLERLSDDELLARAEELDIKVARDK